MCTSNYLRQTLKYFSFSLVSNKVSDKAQWKCLGSAGIDTGPYRHSAASAAVREKPGDKIMLEKSSRGSLRQLFRIQTEEGKTRVLQHQPDRSNGGERGIRTPDTRKGIHAFEARAFSHSAISPRHHFISVYQVSCGRRMFPRPPARGTLTQFPARVALFTLHNATFSGA
ncbi:MAG: hypothetical protein JWQ87_4979 [Candidatus Sulfotelmatobacter sp.]|nr:hypothetical protein [Candidatus Sulfotelmatobacter sp.]